MKKLLFAAMGIVLPLMLLISMGISTSDSRKEPSRKKAGRGFTLQQEYYKFLHQSDSAQYSAEQMEHILNQIKRMPEEQQTEAEDVWSCLGPYGLRHGGIGVDYYSGRITDLRPPTQNSLLRIASGTGGLWTSFIAPISLTTDKIPVDAIGSFDYEPTNPNFIAIGTGETGVRTGGGFYYTTDAGVNWNPSTTFGPNPGSVAKLRFVRGRLNIALAATNQGLYYTSNAGRIWTQTSNTTNVFDVAFNRNADTVYIVVPSLGVYVSTTSNPSFFNPVRLHSAAFGDSVGLSSLAIHPVDARIIYLHAINRYNAKTYGIFRSTNMGQTWTNLLPGVDLLLGNGAIFCEIGISPVNPNLIFAGSTQMVRSTNGGMNWQNYFDNNSPIFAGAKMHADIGAIEFSADGKVYIGNDGGLAYSSNGGNTWSLSANTFPITQLLFMDIGQGTNFAGGTQDNGNILSAGGSEWRTGLGGDGGGVAFNPNNKNEYLFTLGLFGGPISWLYNRTTNFGSSFTSYTTNGIDTPTYHWYTDVIAQALENNTVRYFSNNKTFVYRSTQGGDWQKLNATPFACQQISAITLNANKNTLYASLSQVSLPYDGNQIKVLEGGVWYERSSSIDKSNAVYRVVTHPTKDQVAFACMTGNANRARLYKTTTAGRSWLNFSGGFLAGTTPLPDVPVMSLAVNPYNDSILYAGTEFGIYRSGNNGRSWSKFNSGLPQGAQCVVMKIVPVGFFFPKYYLYVATYGNGVWFREITNDRLTDIAGQTPETPGDFTLAQNYPNPFNAGTEILFTLPQDGSVEFTLSDITGRVVEQLPLGRRQAGVNRLRISSDNLASGVYIYSVRHLGITRSRKMIVLK